MALISDKTKKALLSDKIKEAIRKRLEEKREFRKRYPGRELPENLKTTSVDQAREALE